MPRGSEIGKTLLSSMRSPNFCQEQSATKEKAISEIRGLGEFRKRYNGAHYDLLESMDLLRDTKRLVKELVSKDPQAEIVERRVGRSIIRTVRPGTRISQYLGAMVFYLRPAPSEFLLKANVARALMLGLRGSDVSVRKYDISLCSPEVELHGNLLLAMVSLLATAIKIHVYVKNPTVSHGHLSASLTVSLQSRDYVSYAFEETLAYNKYSVEHLSSYDPASFIGHWLGDKYCRYYREKNVLDIGYCMAPQKDEYVASFISRFRALVGGERSDFKYDKFRKQLILRGEGRKRLLYNIYYFYEKLDPFRTNAVSKVYAYFSRVSRRKHPGINLFEPPSWLPRTISSVVTKKYGRDNVIELLLSRPTRSLLRKMVEALRASGFNAYSHGTKIRLYDRSILPILLSHTKPKIVEERSCTESRS